jgi:hypothetical protein
VFEPHEPRDGNFESFANLKAQFFYGIGDTLAGVSGSLDTGDDDPAIR